MDTGDPSPKHPKQNWCVNSYCPRRSPPKKADHLQEASCWHKRKKRKKNEKKKRKWSSLLHTEWPFSWHSRSRGSLSRDGAYGFRTLHLTQHHVGSRSANTCGYLWSQAATADGFRRGFCKMNYVAAQTNTFHDYSTACYSIYCLCQS